MSKLSKVKITQVAPLNGDFIWFTTSDGRMGYTVIRDGVPTSKEVEVMLPTSKNSKPKD